MDGLKRIYARNCEVGKVPKSVSGPVLAANHRLGDTSCRFRYGLFHFGELVAVAGFSGPRTWRKGENVIRSYEWVRYASLEGLGVDGGMGKLLKAFIDDVHPDDVMSYADASWSDGDVYRKLGFEEEEAKIFPDGRKSLKFRLKLTEYE